MRQKEFICTTCIAQRASVARLHVVHWYIRFQDDNRNNLLARWTSKCLDHHLGSQNFYQGTSCVQRYMDAKTRRTIRRFNGNCNLGDGEGMQVPCRLSLSGQPKFVSLLRKELMKWFEKTNVRVIRRRFELMIVFYEKYDGMFKGPQKTARDINCIKRIFKTVPHSLWFLRNQQISRSKNDRSITF